MGANRRDRRQSYYQSFPGQCFYLHHNLFLPSLFFIFYIRFQIFGKFCYFEFFQLFYGFILLLLRMNI